MTFKIQGIDHVPLAAPEGCEEKARAFYVRHIEDFQENITQKGVSVIVDTARPDVTRFYVLDPFGNRIEFMEHKDK